MNRLIVEILPIIEQVAKQATKIVDEQNEIRQRLVLVCYEQEQKVKELHLNSELRFFLYVVARNTKVAIYRETKREVDLRNDIEDNSESIIYSNVKTLDEMIRQLTQHERMWIDAYLKSGQNYSELARVVDVDMSNARKRIKKIFKRWKQLDIYLPQ